MKKPVIILLHLIYWFIYFCLLTLFYGMVTMNKPRPGGQFMSWNMIMLGFAIIPAIIGFYVSYFVLFRQWLMPRKIALLLLAAACAAIMGAAIGETLLYTFMPRRISWTFETVTGMGIAMALNAALNGAAGLGLKSFIAWYEDIRLKEALNRRNYEMELALIRLQLSPHFLFNTINNIDMLIEQDAVKASAYLNKLSDIMRFMLYETKAALIPLEKELDYINKYIALQQIRTANPDYIVYSTRGIIADQLVPPMLFIPFIENAFKHSVPQKQGNKIVISISVEENRILFECTNAYKPGKPIEDAYGGLGHELIEKRLVLLYAGKHQLRITYEAGNYKVKLSIPLLESL